MSLIGGIAHWLRNEADNIGGFVTGQPAHGSPNPQPQAQVQQPQQQLPAFHPSTPAGQLMLQRIGGSNPQDPNQANPFSSPQLKPPTQDHPPVPRPNLLHQGLNLGNNLAASAGGFIDTPLRAGALGVANLTHNPLAAQNARNVLSEDTAFAKPAGNIISGAAYNPTADNKFQQSATSTANTISNAYAHKFGVDSNNPRIQDLINEPIKQGTLNQERQSYLNSTGINANDSKSAVFRKGVAATVGAASPALYALGPASGVAEGLTGGLAKTAAGLGLRAASNDAERSAMLKLAAITSKFGPKIDTGANALKFGAANAGVSAGTTLGQDNVKPSDLIKSAAQGFAGGAALPVAGHIAGVSVKAFNKLPRTEDGAINPKSEETLGEELAASENNTQNQKNLKLNVSKDEQIPGQISIKEQRGMQQNRQPEGLPNQEGTQLTSTPESRALSIDSTPKIMIEQGKFDPVKYVQDMTRNADIARRGEVPNFAGRVRLTKNGFREKMVDSFAPLEDKMNKAAKKGYKIPTDKNLTYQIDRALRADTIGGQYIKDNGLAHTIQHVPDTKAFDQYLIAKHAADLEAQGIKTGRDSAKDAKLVQSLAPEYEQHSQAVRNYTHGLLDKSVEYGLISPELAAQLKVQYPNYVPFNRIFNDGEFTAPKGTGGGKVSLSKQTVVQGIKGSNREIESPLSNLVDKTQQVIDQGERNKAAQILASYKDMPGNPFELRELKPGETVGNKPTVSYLENGVKHTFETSKEVAEAAKSLNKEQLGLLGRILAVPTRVLRLGATGLNPAFTAANVVKDVGSAFINSKHPIRSLADPEVFLKSLDAALHHGGENYQELVREGAAGTSFDIARNAPKQNIKLIRAEKNVGTKALYTVTHPAQLLRAFEDTIGRSEEYGRASQYFGNKKALRLEGKSDSEARTLAAHAARNNTVNFARAGTYGRVLNSVLPYLNAGIQGSRTLLRNIKERPVQTGTKIAVATFFPVAAATYWNVSDPERKKAYDNISEYEKQNNIIIVPPHPKQDASGRWNVIKIPLSQEIANLGNIVRNGVEQRLHDGRMTPGGVAGNLVGTATSINAQNSTQVVGQLTPQAVKPTVETTLNKNLFTGQQIVPDAIKNLEPQDQKTKNTSGTAAEIGKLFGVSPMKVDNAIKTATGGLGQNLINLSDKGLAAAGVIKPDEVKGKSFITAMANRFNSAQGQTPGSEAFSILQDEAKNQHLVGKGYDALNMIKSKELDANGNPIPTDIRTQLENAATRAADPKILSVETAAAKRLADVTGKPASPFYTQLTPDQQKTITVMQAMKALDPENAVLTKMKLDNASWLDPYNEQSKAYWNAKNIADGTKVTANDDGSTTTTYANGSTSQKGPLSIPSATPEQSAAMQGAKGLTGVDYVNYQKAHPELQDYYTKYDQAVRRIHDYWNEPQYKGYPTASDRVNQLLNNMPQGDDKASKKARALTMQDPEVSDYTADIAMWQLNKGAALNQFEGQNYNQRDLKNISSLGKYDIVRNSDGTFSLVAGTLSDGTKLAQSGQAYTPDKGTFAGVKGTVDNASASGVHGHTGHGYSKYAKHQKAPLIRSKFKRMKIKHNKKPHIFLNKPKSPIKIRNKVNQHPGIHIKSYL